jgi:hypothetical protein
MFFAFGGAARCALPAIFWSRVEHFTDLHPRSSVLLNNTSHGALQQELLRRTK